MDPEWSAGNWVTIAVVYGGEFGIKINYQPWGEFIAH